MIFESSEAPDAKPEAGEPLILWARKHLSGWDGTAGSWVEEAREAYAMVAADQWDAADAAQMEEDDRPMFTFNRIAGFIRGICGLEVTNRQEVRFLARTLEDTGLNEVLNAAAKWVRDECDAEDDESDAFKDMLTCGLGWTETHFTTENDPEGQIQIERIDPMQMRWDTSAKKRGLTDTKWRARLKTLPASEIEERWGKKIADEVRSHVEDSTDALDELFSTPHDATRADEYRQNATGQAVKRGVPVVQFQYFTVKDYYRVMAPDGSVIDIPQEKFKQVQKLTPDLPFQKYRKRQYRQLIYAGMTKFEDVALPSEDFTFQAITGIRDRNKGTWYGFTRDLTDPQKWVNKFFSSMADIVASQAKGGLLAEADAFVNKEQAQDDWANPRSIVWLKRNGLEKIRERNASGIPNGLAQLLEFTVGSLPHVAGVNLEFLGLAAREQAGVLEAQRKQAAIATLAEFFNAMRLYRKQQGRVLLQFIKTYISDGRLIRIVGKEGEQFVPLVRAPDAVKFDVVVDEAPTSPDTKARTWSALSQILPVVAKMGIPIPPEVLDYAPFPAGLQQAWKRQLQGQQAIPPQVQQQMQQMQQQIQQLMQENQKLKSKQEETMMGLQLDQQKAQAQTQMQAQEAQQKLAIEEQRAQRELALKEMIAQRELALKEMVAAREFQMSTGQMQFEQDRQDIESARGALQEQMQGMVAIEQVTGQLEALTAALEQLQQESRQNQQLLQNIQADVDDLDGLEKDVAVDYSPTGEIIGAKVVQRRKRTRK